VKFLFKFLKQRTLTLQLIPEITVVAHYLLFKHLQYDNFAVL